MLKELLLSKSVDAVIASIKYLLKKNDFKLEIGKDDFEKSIEYHLRDVKNWSQEITFSDLKRAKLTSNIYIDLDLYLYPRKIKISKEEKIDILPFNKIFQKLSTNIVLLGQPGAGKTTSIKHLCQNILLDDKYIPQINLPFVVRLRDLNKRKFKNAGPIIETLYNNLGIKMAPEDSSHLSIVDIKILKEKIVIEVLDKLKVLVLLDGFDEVIYKNTREEIIRDIRLLANQLEESLFIVTSRSNDFNYSIDKTTQYEIAPLQNEQIYSFANNWLGDNLKTEQFFKEINNSPFADTAIRPLTLAHLCAIYERVGKIPEKPKTVYRKIVNLLLEEWDEQRSVKRSSNYANFEVDRKFEFLSNLSFILTTSMHRTIFSREDLARVYEKIYVDYGLNINELTKVVNELETHTGLFIESGYEFYEFAHKSIQEYLTAEYIVKLPVIPSNHRILSRLPNELAIAITISSNPSLYFAELILNHLRRLKFNEDFLKIFVNRLILEKPDFNVDSDIVIAAHTLYSLYMGIQLYDTAQLSLFVYDPLTIEFEKFLKLILKTNSKDIIDRYYNRIDKITTSDYQEIYLAELKSKDMSYRYPLKLFTKDTFTE